MNMPPSQPQHPQSSNFIADKVTDVMNEDNWVANLPQLLRYGQDGDYIQVPNQSVLALAEQLKVEYAPETDISFGINNGKEAEA